MREKLSYNDVSRLQEIHDEIKDLVWEAKNLIRGTSEEDRAKGYWVAHILTALDEDHQYLGGSMCTMQETIDALDNGLLEPEDDEDEDEDL